MNLFESKSILGRSLRYIKGKLAEILLALYRYLILLHCFIDNALKFTRSYDILMWRHFNSPYFRGLKEWNWRILCFSKYPLQKYIMAMSCIYLRVYNSCVYINSSENEEKKIQKMLESIVFSDERIFWFLFSHDGLIEAFVKEKSERKANGLTRILLIDK